MTDTIKPSIAQAPWWISEIADCDGLELHPVREITDGGVPYCEQCEPGEAQFWSVFGHLKEGGVVCFEDFETEAPARLFAEELLAAWPHLRTYGLLG